MHHVDFGCNVWPCQLPGVLPRPACVGLGEPWNEPFFVKSDVKQRNKKSLITASCPMFSQSPPGSTGLRLPYHRPSLCP